MQWDLSKINDFYWLENWYLTWGRCINSLMHLLTTWRNASKTEASLQKYYKTNTGQTQRISMDLRPKKKSLIWSDNLQDLFCFVEEAVPQNCYSALNRAGLQTDLTQVWLYITRSLSESFPACQKLSYTSISFSRWILCSKAKFLQITVTLSVTCSCSDWMDCDRSEHKCYLEIQSPPDPVYCINGGGLNM